MRNTHNFWKLRLEKILDIQINYIPTTYTWYELYTKFTSGKFELNQKLIEFSNKGNIQVVQLLLKAGADVRAENNYAIRWASKYGYVEIVKLLIRAGANVTTKNNFAIRWASENGHTQVVKLLLEAGATL